MDVEKQSSEVNVSFVQHNANVYLPDKHDGQLLGLIEMTKDNPDAQSKILKTAHTLALARIEQAKLEENNKFELEKIKIQGEISHKDESLRKASLSDILGKIFIWLLALIVVCSIMYLVILERYIASVVVTCISYFVSSALFYMARNPHVGDKYIPHKKNSEK